MTQVNTMKNIKLILCDLDGTLLDNKKNISKENIDTIKGLKNTKFVIATGRPIEGVLKYIELLNLNHSYSLCYNGGLIIENKTKKIIHSSTISGKIVKEIYNFAIKSNLNFHAFLQNGELITNERNEYTAVEEKINQINAKVVDINSLSDDEKFIKCMIVSSKENLDNIISKVPKEFLDNTNMVRSSNIFLEFLNKDINKGLGLKILAAYLSIDINETMAIGDADNDKAMLEYAGVGVAMENRFPVLDKYADFITKSNEESGVAYAIKHYNVS